MLCEGDRNLSNESWYGPFYHNCSVFPWTSSSSQPSSRHPRCSCPSSYLSNVPGINHPSQSTASTSSAKRASSTAKTLLARRCKFPKILTVARSVHTLVTVCSVWSNGVLLTTHICFWSSGSVCPLTNCSSINSCFRSGKLFRWPTRHNRDGIDANHDKSKHRKLS